MEIWRPFPKISAVCTMCQAPIHSEFSWLIRVSKDNWILNKEVMRQNTIKKETHDYIAQLLLMNMKVMTSPKPTNYKVSCLMISSAADLLPLKHSSL